MTDKIVSKKEKIKILASEILEDDNALELTLTLKIKKECNNLSDDKYKTFLEITKEYY